ncbi:MAG: alpha/beta hydrolase [Actinobacteria bacterium]|nr:alpha/beta hydrolase [Actinomycetota bacterium]
MHLAHERTGSGPALVLIHGITEQRETWRPLIPPLAEHYDVVAVDLRGHGISPKGDTYDPLTLATDVHETLTELGIVAPLVVGHSLGGVVASAYASVARPRAVVNVDQPLALAAFKEGLGQLEPMLRGDLTSFNAAIDLVFESMMGPLPADEAARVKSLRRPDQDVVLGVWNVVLDSSSDELDAVVAALAGGITVPYLSLHGLDPGESYTTWLRKMIPSATVDVWPDQGHYPHLVQPDRFVERIVDFDRLDRT